MVDASDAFANGTSKLNLFARLRVELLPETRESNRYLCVRERLMLIDPERNAQGLKK